jgi:hypothetical protein
MKTKALVSLLVLIVLITQSGFSQSQEKVYSVLLLKLARGIQWPNESQKESFVIGVLSYTPLADELRAATGNIKKGKHTIRIRELTGTDDSDECDILFIPSFKSKNLPSILSILENRSTLIVTNKFDMTKLGSGVNFILDNGKIRYEINTKSIEKRGMKISSEIKNMAALLL